MFILRPPVRVNPDFNKTTPTVRIANHADELELRNLLDRLHADNPNPAGLPASDKKVWEVVMAACRGQGGIAGVVDGPEGGIIASIGMFWMVPWWTDVGCISEYWCYVDKEHRRGGRLYKALVAFAKTHRDEMSRRLGYKVGMEFSFLSSKRIDARARLWGKEAQLVGALFWAGD